MFCASGEICLKGFSVFCRCNSVYRGKGAVEAAYASEAGFVSYFCDAHILVLEHVGGVRTALVLKIIMKTYSGIFGKQLTDGNGMRAGCAGNSFKVDVLGEMSFYIVGDLRERIPQRNGARLEAATRIDIVAERCQYRLGGDTVGGILIIGQ